jgi:7-carboxy-7-deazaguanine synthase
MSPIRINEIFLSLQGESSYSGWPCVFVRTTGCPLRCQWCDTRYAYEEGVDLSNQEIVTRVLAYPVNLVEVTGGEPLAQEGVFPLLKTLCDLGKTVLLETGGAMDIEPVDARVHIILDVKCPSSGMQEHLRGENLEKIRSKDEVKFVLANREDYEFAREIITRRRLPERTTVLLSPVWGLLNPREIASWILEDQLPVRLQVQLHKILWPEEMRGV